MILPRGPPESQRKQLWQQAIIPVGLATLCSIVTPLLFAFVSTKTSSEAGAVCKPDGSVVLPFQEPWEGYWQVSRRTSLVWDAQLFLTVVLGFGRFTFSTAKAIDFCWDLIVGRGGQTALAILVYRILQKSMFLTMEHQKVSLPAVAANLTEGFGPGTLRWMFVLLANKGGKDRGNQRLRRLAVLFACTYVLMFASLTSLMTGYQAKLAPYVHQPGMQSLVPLDQLRKPDLIVLDGSRIGVHDNYPTTYNSTSDGLQLSPIAEYFEISRNIYWGYDHNRTNLVSCHINVCNFTSPLQDFPLPPESVEELFWEMNSSLRFMDSIWSLSPPLKIVSQGSQLYESALLYWNWDWGHTPKLMLTLADSDSAFDLQWWRDRSVCQTLNTYQWGFSSLLLFIFLLLTILFTMALAFLRLEVYFCSRLYRGDGAPVKYHLILALAEDLKTMLSSQNSDWTKMTGQELTATFQDGMIGVEMADLPRSRINESRLLRDAETQAKQDVEHATEDSLEHLHWQRALESARNRPQLHSSEGDEIPPIPPREFTDETSV